MSAITPRRHTCLLTGASGFVGANLARRLLAEGQELHCIVRPAHAQWRVQELIGKAFFHDVNLSDHTRVAALVHELTPDWVFNCAAYGAYPDQTDFDIALAVNVVDTLNLVRTCVTAGATVIVHAGSSSEYGVLDHAPTEDEPLRPISAYAATKAAATLMLNYLSDFAQAPVTVLRLYSVYGPWEAPTRLIPTLLTSAARGEWPPMASTSTARDFVFVDDAVDAILAVARHGWSTHSPHVFNVGTGRQTSLLELVNTVRELFGLDGEPQWGGFAPRAWDCAVWVANPTCIANNIGWQAGTGLRSGLSRTYSWMMACAEAKTVYGLGR